MDSAEFQKLGQKAKEDFLLRQLSQIAALKESNTKQQETIGALRNQLDELKKKDDEHQAEIKRLVELQDQATVEQLPEGLRFRTGDGRFFNITALDGNDYRIDVSAS